MIELIFVVWFACFALSVPITFLNIKSVLKLKKSNSIQNLNRNLVKIGRFWSLSSDSIQSLSESDPEQDLQKSLRSCYLIGILGFFSAPGLLFLIIVSVSMHVMSNSKTNFIMNSDLAKSELDVESVQLFFNSFDLP